MSDGLSRDIIYLARSRLHRSRANLIQTLHTVAGFMAAGCTVRVFMPPWPRRLSVPDRLKEMGIDAGIDLTPSQLLHPRWGFRPFVLRHRRMLAAAPVLYTRVPEISAVLAAARLSSHLEIHDVDRLLAEPTGERVLAAHKAGVIQTLLPISEGGRRRLIEAGAADERMHVAPSGVDLAAYANLPPFTAARDRPRVVHLGRLTPDRGLAAFAAAAAAGCDVTIVGSGEAEVEFARCVGVVPLCEVPSWYAQSDITLLPYQPEIDTVATMSPIKVFEALAAGRPIIASDLPTIREILTDGQTALLVAPKDNAAWVDAIHRLRDDPELALRLAASAKSLAERYTWEGRAQGILAAIETG